MRPVSFPLLLISLLSISFEVDLVAHSGESMGGSFAHTLVLTDIATGWTECVALLVREASLVVDALERLREVSIPEERAYRVNRA